MPKFFPVFNNFTSGLLSPLVQARVDTKAYANGLKQCDNFIILPHGGLSRRGGFEMIVAANSTTGPSGYESTASRLIPFIFSTSPENSYILEFDGAEDNEVIRVIGQDGSVIQTLDASGWFDAEDVKNIRYAQSADVLYLVDGVHPIHKITRSGTVASPSFALTESLAVGSPYSPVTRRNLKIYRTTVALWASTIVSGRGGYGNTAEFTRTFSEWAGVVYLEKTMDLEDETYGVVFGNNISSSENYDNESDTIDKIAEEGSELRRSITIAGDGSTKCYAFDLTSQIYIPEADSYSFAINLNDFGDVLIDEDKVVSVYTKSVPRRGSYDKDTPYEFNKNGASDSLSVGTHEFKARFFHYNHPSWHPTDWGISVAWRKGSSVITTGNAGTGVITVDRTNNDYPMIPGGYNGQWCGNKVYDVIVKISPDGSKWGWTWRLNSNHPTDESTDWPDDEDQYIPSGDPEDSPDGWLIPPTNSDGGALSQIQSVYQLNTTGTTSKNLGKIILTGTPSGGDTFTFKMGYQPIPANQFRSVPVPDETLYPSIITFHQNRMWLGFNGIPLIRASKTGDFENFERGSNANEALEFIIASGRIDTLRWIKSGRRLIVGTLGAEYVIDSSGGVITPDDILVVPHTYYGSKFVDPIQVENSIIFVEKNGIRLRDYYYRYDIDGYFGDDQSILSYEEIKDGIKEIVYQQAGLVGYLGTWSSSITIPPINIIWVVTEANSLRGITFEKNHNVIAWHEHSIGGEVQSVAVIPGSSGAEDIWALVKRDSGRWIERLSNTAGSDSDGGTDEEAFTATAELLPVLFDEKGQTIQDYKKRFIDISAKIYAGQGISVAEGSETFSSAGQLFNTVSITGPENVTVSGTGWDKDLTLVLKSEPTVVTGATYSFPAVIMDIHGKMVINEP